MCNIKEMQTEPMDLSLLLPLAGNAHTVLHTTLNAFFVIIYTGLSIHALAERKRKQESCFWYCRKAKASLVREFLMVSINQPIDFRYLLGKFCIAMGQGSLRCCIPQGLDITAFCQVILLHLVHRNLCL